MQPDPAGVRRELAAPLPPGRSSDGTTWSAVLLGKSSSHLATGQGMTRLSCFQKQHPSPCWDGQIKGVVLPLHGGFNGCRRGFYLWNRTQRQKCWLQWLPSAPLAGCQGGSDLPWGCEELGRTGTFSKRSQRELGFHNNLVVSELVSQILLSLAEAHLLGSLALGCKADF